MNTPLDTPIRFVSDRLERVTVTDQTHPLYGRTFDLATTSRTANAFAQIRVVYRDDILLKIPLRATSLQPSSPRTPTSKITDESIKNFLTVSINIDAITDSILRKYCTSGINIRENDDGNALVTGQEIEP